MEIVFYILAFIIGYHIGVVSGYGTGIREKKKQAKILNVVFDSPTKIGDHFLFYNLETEEFLAQDLDYREGINKIAKDLEEGQIVIAVERTANTYAAV